MSYDNTHTPKLEDITAENLTDHVIKISSNISNERVKYIFSKLIKHAHDFVREVDLQTDEWEATWQFLAAVCLCPFSFFLPPPSFRFKSSILKPYG